MYDDLSADYDRFIHWDSRLAFETPFLVQELNALSQAIGRPAQVLDAACGTGRHAITLALHGFPSAGADLSAAMIERARANAAEAEVDVSFLAGGFGSLRQSFQQHALFPFDAVLCLGNSLPHLLTPADLAAALMDFRNCLRAGGLLIIQNRNFDSLLTVRERWMEPQSHREDDREWIFIRFYDYNPDGRITFNLLTLTREGNTAWQQRPNSTHLWPQRQAELTAALVAAGFSSILSYGSLGGAQFDPSVSSDLVLVAQRL